MSPTKWPRKIRPCARNWSFFPCFSKLACEVMPVRTQSPLHPASVMFFVVRLTLRKCWFLKSLNCSHGLLLSFASTAASAFERASSGKTQASAKLLIFSFVSGGVMKPVVSASTFFCSGAVRSSKAMRQTMRWPSCPQAKAFDADTMSSARTPTIFRMPRSVGGAEKPTPLLHRRRRHDLRLRELLLQRVEELLRVADDDDRRRAGQALLGELLDL